MMDYFYSPYVHDDCSLQTIKCKEEDGPSPNTNNARKISIDSHDALLNDIHDLPEYESNGSNSSSSSNIFHCSILTGSCNDFHAEYGVFQEILGTGAYGYVRECLHRSSGKFYAVKTIDKSKIGRLDHIQREIYLLSRVNHPSVMKMVDCYEDENYVHIVTEKYDGGELFDVIMASAYDKGCLPEDQVVKIVKSLLEAVQYLHANNIVHRDIKPENIMFEDEKRTSVKLIDFGLAREHGVYEAPMVNPVGSAYYMSPAVLRKEGYDRSCDLWAIGVVAYILLAGYPPFNGHTDEEVHDAILRCNLRFDSEISRNLSHDSIDFVRKLLSLDSSRISTANEALHHPWFVRA